MHKLVILVELSEAHSGFHESWPEFLHHSEEMPGLRRESTSWVQHAVYGNYRPLLIHELFFDSMAAIQEAMSSPQGQAAGQALQEMSGGQVSLLIADHSEDTLENIRKFRKPKR